MPPFEQGFDAALPSFVHDAREGAIRALARSRRAAKQRVRRVASSASDRSLLPASRRQRLSRTARPLEHDEQNLRYYGITDRRVSIVDASQETEHDSGASRQLGRAGTRREGRRVGHNLAGLAKFPDLQAQDALRANGRSNSNRTIALWQPPAVVLRN